MTIGRYGDDGMTLAIAREGCSTTRKMVTSGVSPALDKQRDIRQQLIEHSFGALGQLWLKDATMADSTRSMRRSIFDCDILPFRKQRLLKEITSNDLRQRCARVKERGAPATAIHVRDIVK